jgi:hypothetical protein
MAVLGWVTKRVHLLVAAGFARPAEKALVVGVKKVVNRRRPAQVLEPDLRDDAPTEGPSYPSGHAAIANCGVVLAAPYLPVAVTAGLAGTVAVTAYTRVHQGAHFPARRRRRHRLGHRPGESAQLQLRGTRAGVARHIATGSGDVRLDQRATLAYPAVAAR